MTADGCGFMIKGIIFDMDGLLIDTESLLSRFWCEAAHELGFDMRREHVLEIRSLAAKYAEPKLRKIVAPDFDYYAVRARRIELMNAHIDKHGFEVKPGLFELLDFLDGTDILKAVATATDIGRTRRYLERIGIFGRFDSIVCGDMVENGKPEPDIYLKAAKSLGLPAGLCFAAEDSPNGITSAYRAGCKPIMVPDLDKPSEQTRAMLYACADTLADIIPLIKRENGLD